MLSNRNIVTQMRHATEVLEYRDDEERLAVPADVPCRRAGRRLLLQHRDRRSVSNFAESPGDRAGQSPRVAADVLFRAVPRIWEQLLFRRSPSR